MLDQTPRPARERTASQAVTVAPLAEVDPELAAVLTGELGRQRGTLEMIASENFAPRAVLEAQGSVLTNKYAEGYPGKRYYGGCEYVDVAEDLALDRAKALFGAEYANVQPHSGAQANAAVHDGADQPRRPHPRARARARRPPHARHAAQLLRQALRGRRLRRGPADDPGRHGRGPRARRSRTGRRSSSPAGRPTRASSTSPRSARSPTRSARCSGSTWRTSPASSPRACTRTRCRTRTSSPRRCTRPSAARARGFILAGTDELREEAQLGRVPRPAGRTAHARHRREGGRVQDRCDAGVQGPPGAHHPRRADPRRAPASPPDVARGRHRRAHRRHRRAPGARRPARLAAGRPAGRGPAARGRASPSTATPCRSTRARRWSPRACGSGRRRSRPAASATPSSPRSPTSSPTALQARARTSTRCGPA